MITDLQREAIAEMQGKFPASKISELLGVSRKTVYRVWSATGMNTLRLKQQMFDRDGIYPEDCPAGAEFPSHGMWYKRSRGKLWRWSDLEGDWVLSTRDLLND